MSRDAVPQGDPDVGLGAVLLGPGLLSPQHQQVTNTLDTRPFSSSANLFCKHDVNTKLNFLVPSECIFTFAFLFQEIEIKIESLDTFPLILKLVEILNRPQSEPNSSCESISAFSSHKALSIKRNKFYNLVSLSMILVQQMRTHFVGPMLNVA